MEKINPVSNIFYGRELLIATMHKKENVIAPILTEGMGVNCTVASNFDSDVFGTFSGEIERKNSPLDTVRNKALAAACNTSYKLIIASEGSFGPHPSSPFLSANEEIVVLLDLENNLEIVGRHFSVKTNFAQQTISNLGELIDFQKQIGFPEFGLIIRSKNSDHEVSILKDILDPNQLHHVVRDHLENGCVVTAETDMRATRNSTRMKNIELATLNLLENIKSICPSCSTPGFFSDRHHAWIALRIMPNANKIYKSVYLQV